MRTLEPEYYEKFACLCGDCTYTCCKSWNISISRAEYMKLRALKGPIGPCEHPEKVAKRIPKATSDEQYALIQFGEEGFCPFYDDGGMCSLQKTHGAGILPYICISFPRQNIQMNEYLQYSCSTGCVQVVNLLLQEKNGLRFVERNRDPNAGKLRLVMQNPVPGREALQEYFEDVQALCIAVLQDTRCTLDERMILLGFILRDLDEAVAQGPAAVRDWLAHRAALVRGDVRELTQSFAQFPANPLLGLMNTAFWDMSGYPSIDKSFFGDVRAALGLTDQSEIPMGMAELEFQFDAPGYAEARRIFAQVEQETGAERLLENVLVNLFFNMLYPNNGGSAWDNYLELCSIYSYFRVVTAAYVSRHPDLAGYTRALVVCSQNTFHMKHRLHLAVERFHKTKTDTLAHMAMLVKSEAPGKE